jgi:raffinose/stachyose/melibiose transport system permease protein
MRALYFVPTILSSVSVAFVWRFMYDPNFGLINQTLSAVGLERFQSGFLGDAQMAIHYVALTQVWAHAGQLMVIFIAGLQQIPQELYEAADLDGASRWQRFRSITWPLVAPTTAIVVAYTTIQSFKAFDLILGLGGNPPKSSLDILSTRIYTTFTNAEFGYAAAESLVFMFIIAAVSILQRRALRFTQRGV